MTTLSRYGGAAFTVVAATFAAACGGTTEADTTAADTTETTTAATASEVATAQPRLALTYDGGVLVVDEEELTVVDDFALDGFNRLSPAGDGRHVLISTEGGFRALDTGSWTEAHGDHGHHYAGGPALTDLTFAAEKPGHVVPHAGVTALFDDGTGRIDVFDPADLASTTDLPHLDSRTLPEAHHGVAVPMPDGGMLVTLGDSEERTGVALLDENGTEITRAEQCPGVHGETVAADGVVAFRCEDGMAIFRDGTFTKASVPDPYGRIGNQAGSEDSPVVLGDYKTDPDAELERPERVALVDTRTASVRLVDLGTSYTFRSLGRGPAGEALVLGTDGNLHVIDPESGEIVRRIEVLEPWTEPDEWQTPRPALEVQGGTAFVTDPATDSLYAVDVASGEIRTAELPHTPNEISGVA
ncbi:zinc metallochaperone AztD [Rhodococcus pyridinivorans]|uniref:zinc metallochaperone AztD n=1 Tax=Rhodococcus pyridinivorans TaxID=103816 RepID=UPI0022844C52|nr:zinc metallochaperone AztD [Rhodococcus pyridinivorans]WAL46269.1 zinc metallochaperone AztD [Rhodococcus pyridinivorans]